MPNRLSFLRTGKLAAGSLLVLFLHLGCAPKSTSTRTPPGSLAGPNAAQEAELSATELLHQAVQRQDWKAAEGLVEGALISSPSDPVVIEEVARVRAFTGKKREAARLLIDAATIADFQPDSRVQFAIRALIEEGELYKAIEFLEQVVQARPDQHDLRRTLLGFLGEAERYEKVPPHLQKLIQARHVDVPLLIAVTENSVRRFSGDTISTMVKRNPNDHRVRLAAVRQSLASRDAAAAERVLKEIVEHHPSFAPAHALLGQTFMEDNRLDDLSKWAQQVPQESKRYASYWIAVGDFAAVNDRPDESIRAFWEATRCDPNSSTAWSRLAGSLRKNQSDPSISGLVQEDQLLGMEARTNTLLELRTSFYIFSGSMKTSQTDATNVAALLFQLGRNWEAEAWSAVATQLKDDPAANLTQLRRQIVSRLRENQDWIATNWDPALQADLSQLPMPSFDTNRNSKTANFVPSRLLPVKQSSDHIRYSDQADRWQLSGIGLKSNPRGEPFTVIRTTGVGAGAIDYDLDGSPDILVVGGGGSIGQQNSQPNELMRNVGARFRSVTVSADVLDETFGQGIAVGDYNEDGFPDMFFANLGVNRLLRNNGDGTFTDRTEDLREKTLSDDQQRGVVQWTTCGAFADVDADQIADLVITNYCELDNQFDESPSKAKAMAKVANGDPTNFHPLDFPAQKDGLFRASGDGTFADQSASWTANLSQGRGLGVVAGAFDGKSLGVYVANDMSANNFVSLPSSHSSEASGDTNKVSQTLVPLDSAAARGLAVDARTLTQASMGIASSDLDGDGDIDFYVSGFAREYNIYYEQVSPGLWVDHTNRMGLVKPTLMMVGFGTEAIDMDNDGIDELIVANGNIGSFIDPKGVPYEQPIQIFRRDGTGKFTLVPDDSWGKYFADNHVGRALLTADFNRDGHVDALVTQKHESVSLLMNETKDANHHVAFQLVATDASRDAVGSIVRFDCGNRNRILWAMSGDGYLCSNEKTLRAGLGEDNEIRNVTVTWQDGSVDEFGTLSGDQRYLLVQKAEEAFVLE